ncbi:MAG: amidohydrolase family protein [Gemmatimonadota bacterium]
MQTARTSRSLPAVALLGLVTLACDSSPAPPVAPRIDHHLHLRSEAAADLLLTLDVEGEPAPEPDGTGALIAEDVLRAMDQAGVERGLVLSNAYLFGMPDQNVPDELGLVRAENDFVASQAARYPDRLTAFCSVNPLRDYAAAEVERCAADVRLSGLKLHFTNSDLDLRNPDHVARLRVLFERLDALEFAVVVHMRTRRDDYGAQDARIFIDEVLAQVPDLPVQIAHVAGWGGYDDATDAALGAFAEAFRERRLNPARISFDVAAVVFQPEAAGADTALAARVRGANQRLAERIRGIGIERFVYATDWPSWPPVPDPTTGIEANVRLLKSALPLSPVEMGKLFDNVSVVLQH